MSEGMPPSTSAPASPLDRGRDALARHAWQEAFEQLSQADRGGQLSGADLESLALDIARAYGYAGKYSIASAWKRRAEQLIGTEGETYAHGYLALIGSEAAGAMGEVDAALSLAERAVEIGNRAADPDLKAYALTNLGALKIASGATSDGFAMMEEASIAAVASAETLGEAGDVPTSDTRSAPVKGVAAPLSLAAITWTQGP